jgi:FixJ family two-component response regulator
MRGLRRAASDKAIRSVLVLVADGDDDIREAICEVLAEENGWNVLGAKDGPEALALAIEKRPGVLILDHGMPGMTGGEVVRALDAAGLKVPVVLLAAAAEVRGLAESLGIAYFLGKPFGFDQLTAVVIRALGGGI